jgi:single-stranded-DNA-specific exonuclease
MIALDELGLKSGVGSARSVPGFDLHAALCACSEALLGHGGHAAAAGLKIDPARVDEFRASFVEYAAGEIGPANRTAELRIDAEVPFSSLSTEAVQLLERLAPFGYGNPRPVLCATNVVLSEPPRKIGNGERHLSLRLHQNGMRFRSVAFGGGDWAEPIAAVEGELAIAFRPVINDYNGRRTVELHVCDWHPAAASQHVGHQASKV